MLLQLLDHAALLELVHLDHSKDLLEVVAGVRRELLQGQRILREAVVCHEAAGRDERLRSRNLQGIDGPRERTGNLLDHADPNGLAVSPRASWADPFRLASDRSSYPPAVTFRYEV